MTSVKGLSKASPILVVDAHPNTNELLKIGLGKLELENVTFVADSYQALRLLARTHFELIIHRNSSSYFNTFEFATQVLADFSLRWCPIVSFEQSISEEDLTNLRRVGVEFHFTLPLTQKALTDAVTNSTGKQREPQYPFQRLERARLLSLEGKIAEAELALSTLFESDRLAFRARIREIHLKRCGGDFENATSLCEEMKKAFPTEAELEILLGEIKLQKQDVKASLECFNNAVLKSDGRGYNYEFIANLFLRYQYKKEAEEFFREGMSAGHNLQGILDGLATVLMLAGKREEALRYFTQLSESHPTEVKYLNNMAVCFKALGKLDGAVENYKRALSLEPSNSKVMFNLGLLFLEMKDRKNAVEFFRKCLDLEPENERVQLKLLQIEDPQAYQQRLKEIALGGNVPKKSDTYTYCPKPVILDPKLAEGLEGLLASIKELPKPSAFRPSAVASYKMDLEVMKRLQAIDDIQLKYEYFEALFAHRLSFDVLTQKWLGPLEGLAAQSMDFVAGKCFQIYIDENLETEETIESIKSGVTLSEAIKRLQQKHPSLKEPSNIALGHVARLNTWGRNLRSILRSSSSIIKMPEDLWRHIEEHFSNLPEQEFIRKVFKNYAGKIPERPGPEVMESRGDLPRRIANFETDFAHWKLFNYVSKKICEGFSSRLDEEMPEFIKQASAICGNTFTDAGQRKVIFEIIQAAVQFLSPVNLGKLELVLEKMGTSCCVLTALIRSLRAHIEFRRKLMTFEDVLQVFASMHVDQIGATPIKEKMNIFSPSFETVWLHISARCRTAQEKESLKVILEEGKKKLEAHQAAQAAAKAS